MLQRTYFSNLLILISLLLHNSQSALLESEVEEDAPAELVSSFPNLFDASRRQVKIVLESVSSSSGYIAYEEYIDLDLGKAAIVAKHGNTKRVLYQSAREKFSADYRPYTCLMQSPPKIENWIDPDDPLFRFSFAIAEENDSGQPIEKIVKLNLGGVAGLWLITSSLPKSVEKSQIIYSKLENYHRPALVWKAKLASSQNHDLEDIRMFFLSKPGNPNSANHLEKISITDKNGNIRRTINVISIEYSISNEESQEFLELPVGYGCFDDNINMYGGGRTAADLRHSKSILAQQIELSTVFFHPGQYSMELTASHTDQYNKRLVSETVHVETERLLMQPIRSVRIKNSKQDIKTVYDKVQQVAFQVDLREGSCDVSHLSADPKTQKFDDSYEHAVIKFNNGLTLDLNLLMDSLQYDKNYHFIKSLETTHSDNKFFLFEGKEDVKILRDNMNQKLIVRVVRSFELMSDEHSLLRSLTVWVVDPDKPGRIEETYQINFSHQKEASLADALGLVRFSPAFDISEQCYLNNDQMRSGKDYAWVHLKYYADELSLRQVRANEQDVKTNLYIRFLKLLGNDAVRLPKLEISYQEDAFVFQALVLDLAPFEYSYDFQGSLSLAGLAELQDLTSNLKSCASLCRLHKCIAMTYCSETNTCLSTTKKFEISALKQDQSCNTYVAPSYEAPSSGLQNLLARLQHTNYAEQLEGLPEIPDELNESLGSSDDPRYIKIRSEYSTRVLEYLKKSTIQLPELALYLGPHGKLVMPSEFRSDSDPLSEFDLLDSKSDQTGSGDVFETDDQQIAAFHVGQKMVQLKLAPEVESDEKKPSLYSRYLTGVTHDQCATVCRDARCGLFSYCPKLQECVVSSVFSLGEAEKRDLIKPSIDCYIMERDYLKNFQEFPLVPPPANYKSKLEPAGSTSECALSCIRETNYNCLSFQHCLERKDGQQKMLCYFQSSHTLDIVTNQMDIFRKHGLEPRDEVGHLLPNKKSKSIMLCTHYSRSYLADFKRFEYRAIEEKKLNENFETSSHHGLNVFNCAKKCYLESDDCTAFQACKSLPKPDDKKVKQDCQLILGRRKQSEAGSEQSNGESKDSNYDMNKLLVYSEECQLFALRRDSVKAHLHHLMLSELVSENESETAQDRKDLLPTAGIRTRSTASVFFSLVFMFTGFAFASAAMVCTIVYLRDSPEARVRRWVERARVRLHL